MKPTIRSNTNQIGGFKSHNEADFKMKSETAQINGFIKNVNIYFVMVHFLLVVKIN